MMNKTVSVITRTKDRAIFLERVFTSVIEQSYRPIEWVLVNDGGNSPSHTIETLQQKYRDKLVDVSVKIVERTVSTTMEAAANAGISIASGEYVVLLDDDDTWKSTFLEQCINYMEEHTDSNEAGVVTQTEQVVECFEDGQIKQIDNYLFNPNLFSIDLVMLGRVNQFTTHSFVYKKIAWEALGGYDESLPVQGDWEFNLRFLSKYDVGVIPEPLANYHIRRCENTDHSNTITNKALHAKYESGLFKINALKGKISSLVREISNYEISTSWRITKPLRKIKQILKGN